MRATFRFYFHCVRYCFWLTLAVGCLASAAHHHLYAKNVDKTFARFQGIIESFESHKKYQQKQKITHHNPLLWLLLCSIAKCVVVLCVFFFFRGGVAFGGGGGGAILIQQHTHTQGYDALSIVYYVTRSCVLCLCVRAVRALRRCFYALLCYCLSSPLKKKLSKNMVSRRQSTTRVLI